MAMRPSMCSPVSTSRGSKFLPAIDEDRLPFPRIEDGILGHHQPRPRGQPEIGVHEHIRLQAQPRIGNFNANLQRARLRVELGLDVAHRAAKRNRAVIRRRDHRRSPHADRRRVPSKMSAMIHTRLKSTNVYKSIAGVTCWRGKALRAVM